MSDATEKTPSTTEYLVQRKDKAGWFDVGKYPSRTAANTHARLVRTRIRNGGDFARGKVRIVPVEPVSPQTTAP